MLNGERRVSISILVVILLPGCGGDEEPAPRPQPPEGAVAGDYESVPCVHVAREVEYEAECGTLIVSTDGDGMPVSGSGSGFIALLPLSRLSSERTTQITASTLVQLLTNNESPGRVRAVQATTNRCHQQPARAAAAQQRVASSCRPRNDQSVPPATSPSSCCPHDATRD